MKLINNEQMNQFNHQGYLILKNFFSLEAMQGWEDALASLYAMQTLKLTPLREKLSNGLNPLSYLSFSDFSKNVMLLEEFDKQAAYQVMQMATQTRAAKIISADDKLTQIAAELLNCPQELLIYGALAYFINIPSTVRTATKWHSEASYYPKRRNLLNIWIPTFTDKTAGNGTMWILPKSHLKQHWDFIEYFGYDEQSVGKKHHIKQLQIPDEELKDFAPLAVEASRGDLVVFQRNLVHKTGPNPTQEISLATVLRIFDYRKDLTLDANASAASGFPDYAHPSLSALY